MGSWKQGDLFRQREAAAPEACCRGVVNLLLVAEFWGGGGMILSSGHYGVHNGTNHRSVNLGKWLFELQAIVVVAVCATVRLKRSEV